MSLSISIRLALRLDLVLHAAPDALAEDLARRHNFEASALRRMFTATVTTCLAALSTSISCRNHGRPEFKEPSACSASPPAGRLALHSISLPDAAPLPPTSWKQRRKAAGLDSWRATNQLLAPAPSVRVSS